MGDWSVASSLPPSCRVSRGQGTAKELALRSSSALSKEYRQHQPLHRDSME